MKKIISAAACSVLLVFFTSCTDPRLKPGDLYITGSVSNIYSDTLVIVHVTPMGSADYIRDAVVKMNGVTIPYDLLSESYTLLIDGEIAQGQTVTLTIDTSYGDFSASSSMPAVLGTVTVPIPEAYSGSKLTLQG